VASISDNLALVRERIAVAASRSGREPAGVTLVAVTKYASSASIAALVDAGCLDLGESRPQQLWQRAAEFADRGVRWHMIGHLQRNKVARTAPLVSLVHSCDSLRIAAALDQAAEPSAPPIDALLEVNISADPAKGGFAADEVAPALDQLAGLRHVQIRGLMAMAGKPDDAVAARADFRRLRELRDRLQSNCPPGVSLDELSMGMSGDYEVAIEEGATIVRVGSALFEDVDQ
jgi:pyridoxal phosphate enzyme (YggS family)